MNDKRNNKDGDNSPSTMLAVESMYENWFLEYASYVILERAIPAIEDGLKPVQRRILHAMHAIDDGRYNKVANIVGHTMQYHPHGDASITESIVGLGQKGLLIDTQGNWGDGRTGDSAAAARYIEARLSFFGKEILYSPKITNWQLSYDGRKKEPHTLPVKFPLLLVQGVEGIAVGLSTKILPHNFVELIEASIAILEKRPTCILPDFMTGGLADCTQYNGGQRGGKVRIRAKIESYDQQTIAITEIPYGTTTSGLIDSIVQAHKKGKIKIKNVVDNTAEHVEILIHLVPNQSLNMMIDALYMFTDCEISYTPSACVIQENRPVFITVDALLAYTVERTTLLLQQELLLEKDGLKEKIFFADLEKIFIENRIYRAIEECTSWDAVLITIKNQLMPYVAHLYRPIVEEDIIKLTEIKIKRISKYDVLEAEKILTQLQESLYTTQHHLNNLTDYTIYWYHHLLEKYGQGRERKTILTTFNPIPKYDCLLDNQKFYVDRKQGFIGYNIKTEELVGMCSEGDDAIIIRKDGKCMITKILDKVFVGNNILHVSVHRKTGTPRCYHLIYVDGATGISFVKRFELSGLIRDKMYDLTTATPGSRIIYLSDHSEQTAEPVTILLSPMSKATKKKFVFNFGQLAIKGRASKGNILTRHSIYKVQIKKEKI